MKVLLLITGFFVFGLFICDIKLMASPVPSNAVPSNPLDYGAADQFVDTRDQKGYIKYDTDFFQTEDMTRLQRFLYNYDNVVQELNLVKNYQKAKSDKVYMQWATFEMSLDNLKTEGNELILDAQSNVSSANMNLSLVKLVNTPSDSTENNISKSKFEIIFIKGKISKLEKSAAVIRNSLKLVTKDSEKLNYDLVQILFHLQTSQSFINKGNLVKAETQYNQALVIWEKKVEKSQYKLHSHFFLLNEAREQLSSINSQIQFKKQFLLPFRND